MAVRDATEALVDASRVTCREAKEAVSRSVGVRERARATVQESRRIRAAAVIVRDEAWWLPGVQERGA
jgi:hypothetical protein